MSWDVSLKINTGIELAQVCEIGDVTYNNGDIFDLALGMSFSALDTMKAEDALPLLRAAIERMETPALRNEFLALEPSNGWGSFDDALDFLRRLQVECAKHPLAQIGL